MKIESTTFNDPDGKFSITIPATWTYNSNSQENLYQFTAPNDCMFQISVKPIDDHISKIIELNKITPHNNNFPGLSFKEKLQTIKEMKIYSWVAVVKNYFVLGMYMVNQTEENRNQFVEELVDIRLSLRNMVFYELKEAEGGTCPGFVSNDENIDYLDIKYWVDKPIKYFSNLTNKKFETIHISPLKVDVISLYALLTLKVSLQPNGFLDLNKLAKPLDNPIWWDFLLECEKGFINVIRTAFVLEVQYYFDGEFDVELFFNENIENYKNEIEEKIKTFDRHTIYINHYKSYSECVNTLWKEIEKIDLSIPKMPSNHLILDNQLESFTIELEDFSSKSILFHALAKSLVLNAAFKIESYLNLLIRIGSIQELIIYPDVLSKFLKLDFSQRVKNFRFYSRILIADIDMSGDVYRETKELMTLRNKYVHYEEDAIHNKLGEVFYDGDYPLQGVEENRPAVDSIIKTFHQPNLDKVRKVYEISNKFVQMLEALFIPEMKNELKFLVEQNPIGYNETQRLYSAVYNPVAVDFFSGI